MFFRSGRLRGRGARTGKGNYAEESDLTKMRGGGGGGGGGYLKRRLSCERAGRRRGFVQDQISRTVRNFLHCAKF